MKLVKARKPYNCDHCGSEISIGQSYVRINIKDDKIYHFCDKECLGEYINDNSNEEIDWDDGRSSNGL